VVYISEYIKGSLFITITWYFLNFTEFVFVLDEINVQADEIEGISRIGMRRKNPTIILKNAAPRQTDMASPNAVVLNENGGEMEMQPPAPTGRHYQRQPSNDVIIYNIHQTDRKQSNLKHFFKW